MLAALFHGAIAIACTHARTINYNDQRRSGVVCRRCPAVCRSGEERTVRKSRETTHQTIHYIGVILCAGGAAVTQTARPIQRTAKRLCSCACGWRHILESAVRIIVHLITPARNVSVGMDVDVIQRRHPHVLCDVIICSHTSCKLRADEFLVLGKYIIYQIPHSRSRRVSCVWCRRLPFSCTRSNASQ